MKVCLKICTYEFASFYKPFAYTVSKNLKMIRLSGEKSLNKDRL